MDLEHLGAAVVSQRDAMYDCMNGAMTGNSL
jgi:hypothetical protein